MSRERDVIRELAKAYMEIASSEKNARMRKRFRDTNDLKCVRPPLIMEEIPWHEMNMDGELDCVCEDPRLRDAEWYLRVQLYRHRHFACDNYIEPYWNVRKSYSKTDNGFVVREDRRVFDPHNHIVSHHYEDVLEEEEALAAFRMPVITAYPENDVRNVAFYEELLGDIIPVRLIGHMTYYAPWDQIARLRGVEPILIDTYDRPEHLHKIISLYTEAMKSEIAQMRALNLYGEESSDIHCTPAAVTYPEAPAQKEAASAAPAAEDAQPPVRCWFRTMAQMFSSISPEMHYDFDIAYTVPLSKQFAYTYYGCCEPLDDRIEQLKRYPSLRKVGCSPWANVARTAEQLEGKYVLSRKPNPANVGWDIDASVIRQEISETVELCQRYGCPCDITLKDIGTVGYKPARLIEWSSIAAGVLDYYYGVE